MTPESSAYDASLGYHPSAVPLDISLGLTSPPSRVGGEGGDSPRPLRWGVLATGKAAFTVFDVSAKMLTIRHIDSDGIKLYEAPPVMPRTEEQKPGLW